MALECSYDAAAGIVRIVGRGAVSVDDRVQFIRRVLADPDLPAVAAVLVDVSGVSNAPTPDEVRVIGRLAERVQARFRGRVAILNVTVGHVTISHLVALSADDGHGSVRVFTSADEARGWLGGSDRDR